MEQLLGVGGAARVDLQAVADADVGPRSCSRPEVVDAHAVPAGDGGQRVALAHAVHDARWLVVASSALRGGDGRLGGGVPASSAGRRRARDQQLLAGDDPGASAPGSSLRPDRCASPSAGGRWLAATRPCAPCTTATTRRLPGAEPLCASRTGAAVPSAPQLVVALAAPASSSGAVPGSAPGCLRPARRPTRRRAAGRPARTASRHRWRPANRAAPRSRTCAGFLAMMIAAMIIGT